MKSSRWPIRAIPDAPMSVKTHGDLADWSADEWKAFREWALNLKDYPPMKKRKRSTIRTSRDVIAREAERLVKAGVLQRPESKVAQVGGAVPKNVADLLKQK